MKSVNRTTYFFFVETGYKKKIQVAVYVKVVADFVADL
jgi:hypothetical protein